MSADKENFLDRWSRRKQEVRAQTPPPDARPAGAPPTAAAAIEPAPPPALPPLDSLAPASDFKPFMSSGVAPKLRRAALKKLFGDAHFNVPDPFEAYSEDYTGGEPIPAAMLRAINDVRDRALRTPEERAAEEKAREATEEAKHEGFDASGAQTPPENPPGEAKDVAGRQDA